ncbi:MAG: hypothetical protein ACLRMZ_27235 [Blautia marasmi]
MEVRLVTRQGGRHLECIKNGVIYGNYETSYSVMAVKYDGTIYTPSRD